MRIISVALLAALSCNSAISQEIPWTWDCEAVIYSEVNEQFDNFEIGRDKAFKITFSRLNDDEWIMTGNAGTIPVVPILGYGVMQFLESTPSGTINVTQVELEGTDGLHRAVHSRHTLVFDEMLPSQRLLKCVVR